MKYAMLLHSVIWYSHLSQNSRTVRFFSPPLITAMRSASITTIAAGGGRERQLESVHVSAEASALLRCVISLQSDRRVHSAS